MKKLFSKIKIWLSFLSLIKKIKKGEPMNDNTKENLLRVLRHSLTALSGFIITLDIAWLEGFDFAPIISVIVAWAALKMSHKSDKVLVENVKDK